MLYLDDGERGALISSNDNGRLGDRGVDHVLDECAQHIHLVKDTLDDENDTHDDGNDTPDDGTIHPLEGFDTPGEGMHTPR